MWSKIKSIDIKKYLYLYKYDFYKINEIKKWGIMNIKRIVSIILIFNLFFFIIILHYSADQENKLGEYDTIQIHNDKSSFNIYSVSDTWPMFHHDAALTGYSKSTAPNTNVTIWTFSVDAANDKPPIVTEDKVFVVSHYVPYLNRSNLFALNEKNGTVLWKFADQGGNIHTSPAVNNEIVYVVPEYHGIYALNESNGDILWNFNGRDIEYMDISYSPTIFNDDVFVSLVARYNLDPGISHPSTYRLDGKTGDVLWKFEGGGGVPSVTDGKVFFKSFETDSNQGHYRINCVNIEGNNDGTLLDYPTTNVIWTFEDFKQSPYNQPTNPVVVNDKVIFGDEDGFLYILNTENGSLIWKYNISYPIYKSTPAIYNNNIFIGTQTDNYGYGYIYCLNYESRTFIWKNKFLGDIESSVAIADNKLFFGTSYGKIYAIDASVGSVVWNYEIGEFGASSPAIAKGKVFITSIDTNLLYCFGSLSNKAPIVESISAYPDSIYIKENTTISVKASDEDNDDLTYHYSVNDGIISGSGPTVTWTAPDIKGTYTITIVVKDYLESSNPMSVDIIVKENHAPIINDIVTSKTKIEIGDSLEISVQAYDEDGDELEFIYDYTNGEVIGSGPKITWRAPEIEGTYIINIKVFDGKLYSKEEFTSLEVYKKYPPIIEEIIYPKFGIEVRTWVNISINASDKNNDDLNYYYEVNDGKITGDGPNFNWLSPTIPGIYSLLFWVDDGELSSKKLIINITVMEINKPPSIDKIIVNPSEIYPGEKVRINVIADDPNYNDFLIYSYISEAGEILGEGDEVHWIAPDELGSYIITVSVKDSFNSEVSEDVSITVIEASSSNNNQITNDLDNIMIIILFICIIFGIIFYIFMNRKQNKNSEKKPIEIVPLDEED